MDPVAGVLLVVLVLASAWERWRTSLDRARERKDWTDERRELLTRIQRPEIVPIKPGTFKAPSPPKDAANLQKIGTVAAEADDGARR